MTATLYERLHKLHNRPGAVTDDEGFTVVRGGKFIQEALGHNPRWNVMRDGSRDVVYNYFNDPWPSKVADSKYERKVVELLELNDA